MNDALLSGSVDFIAAGPPAFITLWDRTRGSRRRARRRGDRVAADVPEHDGRAAARRSTTSTRRTRSPSRPSRCRSRRSRCRCTRPSSYGIGEAFRFDRYTVTMTHPDAVIALLSGANQIDAHFTSPPFHQRELKDPRVHTVLSTRRDHARRDDVHDAVDDREVPRGESRDLCGRARGAATKRTSRSAPIRARPPRSCSRPRRPRASRWTSSPTCCATRRSSSRRTPANVAKYAEFMHAIGSIEHAPESWRDLFFPEIHGAAGS